MSTADPIKTHHLTIAETKLEVRCNGAAIRILQKRFPGRPVREIVNDKIDVDEVCEILAAACDWQPAFRGQMSADFISSLLDRDPTKFLDATRIAVVSVGEYYARFKEKPPGEAPGAPAPTTTTSTKPPTDGPTGA